MNSFLYHPRKLREGYNYELAEKWAISFWKSTEGKYAFVLLVIYIFLHNPHDSSLTPAHV